MRNTNAKLGFTNKFDISLGLNSGNTEYSKIKLKLHSDYKSEKFHSFLSGNVEYKTASEKVLSSKGFIHLRTIYSLSDSYKPEIFFQNEYNKFIYLKDRKLFGLGMRTHIFNWMSDDSNSVFSTYLGIGAMFERELYNTNPEQTENIFRSTNYLSLKYEKFNAFAFSMVTYFQTDVLRIRDHRILTDAQVEFFINDFLSFKFTVGYRYDREPARNDVKMYDLELINGISFRF